MIDFLRKNTLIKNNREILIISSIYIFLQIWFFGKNFIHEYVGGDFVTQWVTHYYFLLQSLKSGFVPLWDPYTFMGVPGIFHPFYMIFYPPIFLFVLGNLLIPTLHPNLIGKSLELLTYFHIFVGMLSMFLLLRKKILLTVHASFAGGFIFGFSIYTTSNISVVAPLYGITLLPLIILVLVSFLDKLTYKNFLFLVIVNYFLFVLSYPYYQIYFFYAQIGLAAFWGIKALLRTGIAIGIAVLLAGILLIPQAYIYSQAQRIGDASDPSFHINSSPPTMYFLDFLMPQAYYLGGSLTWGIIGFIFLVIGFIKLKVSRINIWLVLVFSLCLILAIGGYIGIQNLLGGPPFFQDKLRTHGNIWTVIFFCGTVIVAQGIDAVLSNERIRNILYFFWGSVCLIIIAMLALSIKCKSCIIGPNDIVVSIGRMLLIFMVGLLLTYFLNKFKSKVILYLILFIIFMEFHYYYMQLPMLKLGTKYTNYFAINSLIPEIPNNNNLFRYLIGDNQFSNNTSTIKVFNYLGYDLVPYKASYSLSHLGYPKAFQIANIKYLVDSRPTTYEGFKLVGTVSPPDHPLEKYISSSPTSSVATPLSTNTHYIYELKNYWPRFFVAKKIESCSDKDCYLKQDPPNILYTKDKGISIENPKDKQVKIDVTSYDPNKVVLKVNTPKKTFVASSEVWDKGWMVKINGEKDTMYNVMEGFRGFVVDKGESTVEMRYFPPYFWWGLGSSILGIIMLFLLKGKRLERFFKKLHLL